MLPIDLAGIAAFTMFSLPHFGRRRYFQISDYISPLFSKIADYRHY